MKIKRLGAGLAVTGMLAALPWVGVAQAHPISEDVSTAAIPTDELVLDQDVDTDIVNGTPASYQDHPSIISGMRVGGGGPQGDSCTGSVVGERKILTAAHCLVDADGDKSYMYGNYDLNHVGDELWEAEVVEVEPHPEYGGPNGWQTGYDVAVVTVADDIPVDASDWATYATSDDNGLTEPGTETESLGFGQQSRGDDAGVLMHTEMPINVADDCQVFDIPVDADTMICAGYDDGRTGICSGDSGGPLLVDGTIVGITSWGAATCDHFSIFAKLDGEMGDWVDSVLGNEV